MPLFDREVVGGGPEPTQNESLPRSSAVLGGSVQASSGSRYLQAKCQTPQTPCKLFICPGDTMPTEAEDSSSGYSRLAFAKAAALAAVVSAEAEPVCEHWRSRGYCLLGERCMHRHPPQCMGSDDVAQQHAQLAARQAALPGSLSMRRSRGGGAAQRSSQRRKDPKNKGRASALRRFLLDTFGLETLGQGTGVLDVAGGRGELAFELLNLNGLPATVVEPRPLELARRVKWLLEGVYHRDAAFAHYNGRQWGTPEGDTLDVHGKLQQGKRAERGVQDCQDGQQGRPQLPDHLRLVVTPELAACLTGGSSGNGGRGSSNSRRGSEDGSWLSGDSWRSPTPSSSTGGSSGSLCDLAEGASELSVGQHSEAAGTAGTAPLQWSALFEAAKGLARRGHWAKPGPEHDKGSEAGEAEWQHGSESGDGSSSGRSSGRSSPEPPLAVATPPARRRSIAWNIPADSESEDDCCALLTGGSGLDSQQPAGGEPQQAATQLEPVACSSGAPPVQFHLEAPLWLADSGRVAAAQAAPVTSCEAREVQEAGAAWERFTQCSVVCGLHPDQATEFVVDLALALGKPFAVVPCCVYAQDCLRRTLDGRPVTAYDQFLDYLCGKDPEGRIRVATLPFEGRNKVLYRL